MSDPTISSNAYSVRWTGQLNCNIAGVHNFALSSDEGMRLIIDGTTVLNGFTAKLLIKFVNSLIFLSFLCLFPIIILKYCVI